MYRLKTNSFWLNPEALATPLLVLFLDHYGTEGLAWSPVTILMEIRDDFGEEPHPIVFDRLMAGIKLLTSNDYFVSTPDFCRLTCLLAGEPSDVIPEAEDCAWGITEAMLIHTPDTRKDVFSREIRALLGHILDQEGIINPPDVLQLALRDKRDMNNQIQYDFADDPSMFEAIADVQRDKTEYINTFIRRRMQTLLEQLRVLPVQTAQTEAVAVQLLQQLAKIDRVNPDRPD